MEFKHEGITITVDTNGEFVTIDHHGNQVRKGSLAAMKTHLGKQKAETFKPFTVLTTTTVPGAEKILDSDLYRVEVIRLGKDPEDRRNEKLFVVRSAVDRGWQYLSRFATILRDCQESVAAYKAWAAYDHETDAVVAARRIELDKLYRVVRMLKVDPNVTAAKG